MHNNINNNNNNNITLLKSVKDDNEIEHQQIYNDLKQVIDDSDQSKLVLSSMIFDLFLPLATRIAALQKYHHFFKDEVMVIVSELSVKYMLQSSHLMQEYLFGICLETDIHMDYKLDIAKTLTGIDNENIIGYQLIEKLLLKEFFNEDENEGSDGSELSSMMILDILLYWIDSKDNIAVFQENIIKCTCHFIERCLSLRLLPLNDRHEYIYKSLYSLYQKNNNIGHHGLYYYFTTSIVPVMWKICCAQILLQDNYKTDSIYQSLLEICNDEFLDNNLRGDAADCLLTCCADKDILEQARACIVALAGRGITLYDNAQNVHNTTIEKGVAEILDAINYTPLVILYDDMNDRIYEIVDKYQYDKELVDSALQRISYDQKLYGKYNVKLEKVLTIIWNYINGTLKIHIEELEKRVVEELIDMADTCSSGHISRLINVLSGYVEFGLSISIEDEIIANLSARLFKCFKDDIANNDELSQEQKDAIYIEFLNVKEYERQQITTLFAKYYGKIKNELVLEYCNPQNPLISNDEFELIIKAAVIRFQSGE